MLLDSGLQWKIGNQMQNKENQWNTIKIEARGNETKVTHSRTGGGRPHIVNKLDSFRKKQQ